MVKIALLMMERMLLKDLLHYQHTRISLRILITIQLISIKNGLIVLEMITLINLKHKMINLRHTLPRVII